MKKMNKKSIIIKIGILTLVIGVYLFVNPINNFINQMVYYLSMLDLESLKKYILSFGVWAPIVSFILMILQSIVAPLPAFLITFANAALFGWVKGAILSWTSAMAGAALCFYIARFLGRDTVEKLTSKFALDSIDEFFEKYGKHTILIARLLPFISFDIVSYAAGLTSMSFVSFFIATGIGQLPATIIYSYVGGMLTGGAKLMMMGLLILSAISIFIYVLKKIYNEKKLKQY
ncbi:TVP38/TMEM64 family inner membrane protein ydjZ [uncultured Clostridium sp.]|nr:TVP38/TMEM64 family inner membrane protein ydjZ [uncultured Clostridium sp.]SCJ07682.1 TVP38/TMEM64 family inner membrane protein ydjZ [uncultured Clostridium sp.]